MRGSRVLRFVGIAVLLSLLAAAIPATTALAETVTVVTPASASGPPGTTVVLNCTGFTANLTWTASFDVVSTGYTGNTGNGTFQAQLIVPNPYPRGTYAITISSTGGTGTASFTIVPSITLSAGSGYVGDQVSISGTGFSAGVAITINWDAVGLLTTSSTSSGSLSGVFTVPAAASGSHTVYAYDAVGYASASFSVLPKMAVSPTSGAVGDAISVSGTGYGASQLATVYFDGVSLASIYSDALGTVAAMQLTVPASARGNHVITMTDAAANTYSVTFATTQKATITPTTGPGGTKVTISGTGFNANSAITITFDDAATDAPATTASGIGGFGPVTFDVPASPAGTHTVKASDGTNVDSKTFTVTSTGSITPTSGFVGTKFTVNATGFLGNASVSIYFGDTLAMTVTSGANGSFSASVNVPPKAAGNYQVRITDGTNTITATYAITTNATINPVTSASAPGYVGQQVTVSGVGFIAGRTVTITYDGRQVGSGTAATDNTFSISFTVPASKAGNHSVVVNDGLNNFTLTFVMESTPPPVPTLLKPDNGSRDGATPTFTWTPVNDPSDVTYNLQVASSQDFSADIVLQKTGLTASQYTVSQTDKLKSVSSKTPYYWRVESIDGASNTAGYSTPRVFSVGLLLPMWAIIVFIVLGVIIIALLFFWIGRRASARRDLV